MKQHRTCTRCNLPIAKTHRWRTVYHRFLFWTWATFEHRNCAKPQENTTAVTRLKGEVPLPFPDGYTVGIDLGSGSDRHVEMPFYPEHGQNLPL